MASAALYPPQASAQHRQTDILLDVYALHSRLVKVAREREKGGKEYSSSRLWHCSSSSLVSISSNSTRRIEGLLVVDRVG